MTTEGVTLVKGFTLEDARAILDAINRKYENHPGGWWAMVCSFDVEGKDNFLVHYRDIFNPEFAEEGDFIFDLNDLEKKFGIVL